jgi:hypothetical protein
MIFWLLFSVLPGECQIRASNYAMIASLPIPVAASSKTWVCGRSIVGDCRFDSRRGHGCLPLVNGVLSGRELCDGLVTRPEKSYRMCVCVCVCVCVSVSVVKWNNNPLILR